MFPPNPLAFRQKLAHRPRRLTLQFAPPDPLRHSANRAQAILPAAQNSLNCYTSPFFWPGPSRVRPFFELHKLNFKRHSANPDARINFRFQAFGNALELASITTIDRGSEPCRNPSFSLLSLHCRLPAACKTRHRAALPAQRAALCWLTFLTRTSSPVLRLADLPVRPPAGSRSACRPATDHLTAFAVARPSGHSPRVAFCHAPEAL